MPSAPIDFFKVFLSQELWVFDITLERAMDWDCTETTYEKRL